MPRIQILELPELVRDDGPPFMLIIDQVAEADAAELSEDLNRQALAADVGARTVAVFRQTIDIPDNQVPVDADGNYAGGPVQVQVKADLNGFRAQVEQAIDDARRRINAVHLEAN